MTRPATPRPRGSDDLGLKRALSDRLLPLLVAAMTFLAALTSAGAVAVAGLASQWRGNAGSLVTVQVPRPDDPSSSGPGNRGDTAARLLGGLAGVTVRRLPPEEVARLLRPWLGPWPGDEAASLSMLLPAVFELRAPVPPAALPVGLQDLLERAVPGTLIERNLVWHERLAALAGSLRMLAILALAIVAFVAASVVAVAARAALAARRDAIEIIHGLGGTDGMIAAQFAGRVTLLVAGGALLGVGLAVPVLVGVTHLALPFQPAAQTTYGWPGAPWAMLPAFPMLAAGIGWVTTQVTVRAWLARLP